MSISHNLWPLVMICSNSISLKSKIWQNAKTGIDSNSNINYVTVSFQAFKQTLLEVCMAKFPLGLFLKQEQ